MAEHIDTRLGAGCREVTTVLAPDLVALHAGVLSRRLRLQRDCESAFVGIWQHDDETGGLSAEIVKPVAVIYGECADWRIIWDEEVRATLRGYRASALPRETGGILIGYIDQMLKTLYIVDARPAPTDSVEAGGSFARGVAGLPELVDAISERTAGVVGYVGEWHSHPDGYPALPSAADIGQLCFLAAHLRHDGHPALMLIVGQHREQFVLGEPDE